MFVNFLSRSNSIAFAGLFLGTFPVLKNHGAEGMSIITGAFALLRIDNGKEQ